MEFEISIDHMQFHAHHGVFPQEQKVGNAFEVSLSVVIPFNEQIRNDNIDDSVSYAELYSIVEKEMSKPRKLLETLAADIVLKIKEHWTQILRGKITICKSNPPIAGATGCAKVSLIF